MNAMSPTAAKNGYRLCLTCELVSQAVGSAVASDCPRCGTPVAARKPGSLQRTWALLLAAAMFYVPANVLPIMHTSTLAYDEDDTIMSGIVTLWTSGSWPLALLVFAASIVVPCSKLIALVLLLVTTQRRSSWRLHERARLYRIIEYIGRWSMLDVFVVSLLVGLVHLRGLATIRAQAGAAAFACVVILTMYATQAFDPRLMWEASRE